MPKHKNPRSREEDIEHLQRKIRKLERKIHKREINVNNSKSESEVIVVMPDNEATGADTPALRPDDWLLQWPEHEVSEDQVENSEPQTGPSPPSEFLPEDQQATSDCLDTDTLQILGDDPSSTDKYGPGLRTELASRLLHIVKEGLSRENRKDLLQKYPVPANCVQIDAPKINLEIKAAITDAAFKRDKGIEVKQKQMTCAISCLAEIINSQLSLKERDNDMLQKLMDVAKIVSDLQHADSITRRNLILFALKYDMKEHLKDTKIDTFLFGENLSETLKSAKAVNKSGVELKADLNNKAANNKYKGPASKHLNRKAPPQARRQFAGPALPAPRSREPPVARAPYHQPPPPAPPRHQAHAHSSKTYHHATGPRRRF